MTQTTGGPQSGNRRPSGTDTFLDGLRRIDMRRAEDGWVGGVCAGLAARLGLDPLVIRALFVVLSFALGLGVLAYLAAWLLVPDSEEQIHLDRALRQGEAGSVVLLIATVISVFGSFGWFGGGWYADGVWGGNVFWGLLSLLLLVGGAFWLWSEWRSRPDPGFYGRHVRAASPPPPSGDSTAWPSQQPPQHPTTWQSTTTTPGQGPTSGGPTSGVPPTGAPGEDPSPTTGEHSAYGGGAGGLGATAWNPSGATPPPAGPPPGAPRPPRAPKPPKRPGRRSAGAAGTLLGTGLALAAGGGLYWAATNYDLPGNPLLIAFAGALAALGLTILILGLAGRTSGFPGFLGVVALVCTVLFLPAADHFVPSGKMGEYTWSPRTVAELEQDTPYQVGAGTGTLQLHGLSPEELDGESIRASVGFGQLVIDVPDDLTVQIEAGTAGGVIRQHAGDGSYLGGLNVTEDIVIGDGPIDLTIDARVGFGEIILKGNDR